MSPAAGVRIVSSTYMGRSDRDEKGQSVKFRLTTTATLVKDVRAFADEIEHMTEQGMPDEAAQEIVDAFNKWMDKLHGQDAFGTDGRWDPRGAWTMKDVSQ